MSASVTPARFRAGCPISPRAETQFTLARGACFATAHYGATGAQAPPWAALQLRGGCARRCTTRRKGSPATWIATRPRPNRDRPPAHSIAMRAHKPRHQVRVVSPLKRSSTASHQRLGAPSPQQRGGRDGEGRVSAARKTLIGQIRLPVCKDTNALTKTSEPYNKPD
jgi:hypothetical protein